MSLRVLWRRVTGRCVLCGNRKSKRLSEDLHTHGPYCRRCNKRLLHSSMYGGRPGMPR